MYTNTSNIPLPFAIWLAADHGYDLTYDPAVASATEILRPMRSIILSRELAAIDAATATDEVVTRDIEEKAAASLGTAVHTAVELAWTQHYKLAMANLGYPHNVIDRICINPVDPDPEDLNMYFEVRTAKQIAGFTLSGKFDLVMEGGVRDIKTTKAYTYMKGTQDKKYMQQGSIYRWLNQDIITSDTMHVDYYFTDWSPVAYDKEKDKNYPPSRMLSKRFDLMTLDDTEQFIRSKLKTIRQLTNLPQQQLPRCTPEELWQNPAKYEYWSKATNTRCSKIHPTRADAEQMIIDKKGIGFVKERQFEPTFCKFCDARSICTQAAEFVQQGLLST